MLSQKVLLHVPNGLNGLPPTARSTKTSIVFFGPGPAAVPNANPFSRKLLLDAQPMAVSMRKIWSSRR